MHTGKQIAAMAGFAMAAALLVGCGGPSPTPSPVDDTKGKGKAEAKSTPKSASPSPTPTPDPKFPGKDVSDAALKWLDASNQAMKTLDPAPVLELSDSSCENCNRYAQHLRNTKQKGGRNEGAYTRVPRGVTAPKITGNTAKVTVTVERGDWKYFSQPGAKPQVYKAETYDIKFDLEREDGRWIVTEQVAYVPG